MKKAVSLYLSHYSFKLNFFKFYLSLYKDLTFCRISAITTLTLLSRLIILDKY